MDRGSNPNHLDINKQTAIFYAIDTNHINVVKLLVEFGADVNIRDTYDRTPLSVALDSKNSQIKSFLEEKL